MLYLLAALAVFGHWSISIFAINRIHSTALPYRLMKLIDLIWYGFLFAVPIGVFALLLFLPEYRWWANQPTLRSLGALYVVLCWSAVPCTLVVWLRHLLHADTTTRLVEEQTAVIDVVSRLGKSPSGSLTTSLLSRLPTNQVFQLAIHQKTLRLPRLDPRLDGLTITHLSDLHFTGRVTRGFYDVIVQEANAFDSDLVVISGDVIDKPKCLPWIAEVLGKLSSRSGVYFVLGNHDLRLRDELGLRREIVRHGLVDLGGRYETREIRNALVLLAGNELPWFAPAADMSQMAGELKRRHPLRIAVSHSPDQFGWARTHDFDLMLAGHTHGGQIRLPVIGPIFSPSRYGVRYASGTFFRAPTLMHVSRGLSGTRPLRFNCRPELTQLVLRSDRA
jgi:predicted MPP superfamily phosphohydrolase